MRGVRSEQAAAGVTRLVLDRPERRNALSHELLGQLEAAVASLSGAVVVLDSADPASFCAGADLSLEAEQLAELSDRLYGFYEQLLAAPQVVVAALDGPAVGAGAQLALAADLRVAGRRASLGFVGPRSGLVVGAWRLPRLVGEGRAAEIVLSGRKVAAEEAFRIGLIERLVDGAASEAALELAAELAGAGTAVLARAKALLRDAGTLEALRAEREANRAARHRGAGSRRRASA